MSPVMLLARRVDAVMAPPPPILVAGTSCGEAVERMTGTSAGCILVAGTDGRPIGILTERDVARRVAFRIGPGAPVADVMSQPLHCAGPGDYLYSAIGLMRRLGLRHMPVVATNGSAVGMLHLRDALADATAGIVAQIDRLTHDESEAGLASVRDAEVDVAAAMIADGTAAADIQSLLTHINNDVHRRVIARVLNAMADEGRGTPPVGFSVIVMGSGGRGENYLHPDQDNGFILDDYPDEAHTRIDGYFVELAERVTAMLDTVGFPFCSGNVMATNPLWRKTLSQWRSQTRLWARRRSTAAVRLADILFDFQPVYGSTQHAAALRRHVTALMRGNTAFLQELDLDHSAYGIALGLFGGLRTDRTGEVDIKRGGLLPLVNAVRILALREGVPVTSTLARIAALREIGTLGRDEADDISAAFRHMSDLVLRRQVERHLARQPVGYGLPPRWISRRERRLLVDALRAVARMRDRVHGELTGDVL
jgi:CBS domain-containing protein